MPSLQKPIFKGQFMLQHKGGGMIVGGTTYLAQVADESDLPEELSLAQILTEIEKSGLKLGGPTAVFFTHDPLQETLFELSEESDRRIMVYAPTIYPGEALGKDRAKVVALLDYDLNRMIKIRSYHYVVIWEFEGHGR